MIQANDTFDSYYKENAAGYPAAIRKLQQKLNLMSLLRFCFPDDMQRLNALKNVLAATANGVAAILFIFVAPVRWGPAALIAGGSIIGAQVAARYGRRIPPQVLRWIIVIGGTIVAVILIVT